MNTKRNYLLGGVLSAVAGTFFAITPGIAQAEYPNKPITFIVPYSPGGGSDQQARRLQPGLEKALGVRIRIVYKTGGGGAVGFGELWRSKNDGYTISNVVVPNIVITAKGRDVGFKPGEFAYIGMTTRALGALTVPKNSKFKSLEQFVAEAKANPGKITIAGVGSTGKMNMADLAGILGIKHAYVPVSGGVGKMIPMLLGNHVDAGMTASSHATKHKATLNTLAVAGPNPVGSLPGIPNVKKWGYMTTWGVMAPPGTPADRVAVLNAALLKATADPKVKNMVIKNGLYPMRQTPAEAKAYVEAAIKKFSNQKGTPTVIVRKSPPSPTVTAKNSSSDDLRSRLLGIKRLESKGLITKEEAARKREAILGLSSTEEQDVKTVEAVPEQEKPVQKVAKRPDDIAVIIANSNYQKLGKGIPNVKPAYTDAKNIKRYFMESLGIREGNIIYLKDATGTQMTSIFGSNDDHKGKLFNWTKRNVSKVYVYYAGHGAPAGDKGTTYLVPSDADSETVQLTGYPLKQLYRNLGKVPATSITVILEACFSGQSQSGYLSSQTSGIRVVPIMPSAPKKITVISAGAANQVATWEKNGSQSLFTKYFLKGMSGEGDKKPYGNSDGKVSLRELKKYLDGNMTYYARRYYGRTQQAQIVVNGKELSPTN